MDILEVDKAHVMDMTWRQDSESEKNWIMQKYLDVFFCKESDQGAAVSILQIERQTNLSFERSDHRRKLLLQTSVFT